MPFMDSAHSGYQAYPFPLTPLSVRYKPNFIATGYYIDHGAIISFEYIPTFFSVTIGFPEVDLFVLDKILYIIRFNRFTRIKDFHRCDPGIDN